MCVPLLLGLLVVSSACGMGLRGWQRGWSRRPFRPARSSACGRPRRLLAGRTRSNGARLGRGCGLGCGAMLSCRSGSLTVRHPTAVYPQVGWGNGAVWRLKSSTGSDTTEIRGKRSLRTSSTWPPAGIHAWQAISSGRMLFAVPLPDGVVAHASRCGSCVARHTGRCSQPCRDGPVGNGSWLRWRYHRLEPSAARIGGGSLLV